jgi:murein DD-endopeptidase MepM/ murein hydrolase activator NlpD
MSAGCVATSEFGTAVADGIVTESSPGYLTLDLDGDGDPRTGWVIFYMHLTDPVPVGTKVTTGTPLGHPSCEGGHATGTHVHMARKYNGEWIPAGGALAFNLEGWIVTNGSQAYQGGLTRYGRTVTACDCANAQSLVTAGKP